MKGPGPHPGLKSLLACAILSMALLAGGDNVQSHIASVLASTILKPFQVALTLSPRLGILWLENRQLRHQLEERAWDGARIHYIEDENQRLRYLLDMTHSSPESLIVTSVLAREQSESGEVLYVDRGSTHGLTEGMPVISLARLVGKVDHVEPGRGRVLTLWNLQLRVSIRVGQPGPGGILRWDPSLGPDLLLEGMDLEESIALGDTVLTSGLGEVFPPGILVGRVVAVQPDSIRLIQEIRVRPFVNLSRLDDVLLMASSDSTRGGRR
ncbi:MAG: rod shape-determining protein MreC [Candidatus Eisenbacteria bacterium]|uniref:Cell shape-determining protein MreC n=1 Tax=Eiseniibacteriota bacterium TaxID=2212470 RepID=A0A948RUI3_UNCEI|nr:rod shape-determining protein MreC [Candidatus Eisenbacteria bacterium]MBU2689803.1 rod shape-determining protein MreC [Candidatus Eisenbacteria bacterium]